MNIVPAILPYTFEEVGEKLSRVEGLVTRVQIDLCDGVFGREKTWLPEGNETLPGGFTYEFDIMVDNWNLYVMRALMVGASSIVAHVDQFVDGDMETLVSLVAARNASLGISVSNDKSVEFHADMIRKARSLYPNVFIQVMGINKVGEQGLIFADASTERVRMLKQQFGDLSVQVDGGMTPETGAIVGGAGAETLIVGSYIFGGEDAGGALKRLELIG